MDNEKIIEILLETAKEYDPPEQALRRAKGVHKTAHTINLVLANNQQNDVSQIEIMDIGGGAALFSAGCAALGMKRVVLVDDYDDPEVHKIGDDFLKVHKKHGVEIYSRDATKDGIHDIEGQFDAITSFDSMEHWHNSPKKLFGNVIEKLKPGGVFLLNAPNCVSLRKRITVPFGYGSWSRMADWYEQETFRGHVREPDVATMKYIAKDMGLKNVRILGRNSLVFHRLGLYGPIWTKIDPFKIFPSLCSELYLIGNK